MENKIFSKIAPLKLMPKNKRGMGIGDIYPVVLTIALVAILIAIVMFVLAEFGEQMTNESAAQNATGYSLTNASDCGFNTPAITAAWNVTVPASPVLLSSGNYTLTDAGVLTNASATNYPDVNVSYTYLYGGAPCEATEDIVQDFVDFIPWIGVILLVVAAAIVLGVLMRSFGSGGRV
ncbi:unnamed protein product [marine sediment metagenome]|uniref:Archaeal Type IV pilin N-terminal domain-containing protein n=1 Tax=marine sediment metagenome TaxID=412755 RepID=X1K8B1_9ZZZZ